MAVPAHFSQFQCFVMPLLPPVARTVSSVKKDHFVPSKLNSNKHSNESAESTILDFVSICRFLFARMR